MQTTDISYASSDDVTIAARRWEPDDTSVRAVVQLTHGMGEHVRRYAPLAEALTASGYVVVGQDHRGHGATAGDAAQHGHLGAGGWPALVEDIGRLSAVVRSSHPDVPLVLLGHSMGSFAAQQYVLTHSADVDALVLTGTAAIDVLEPAIDLDAGVDLSAFNAPFAPARTDYDWLSRDEAQVDKYVADPECGFGLDATAGRQMFTGARALADATALARMRRDLAVYIAVGEQDPVNAGGVALDPLVQRYRSSFDDVTLRVYPGARHEILNETNRDEVVHDLLTWLDHAVPA